jgi:hypothetical protein
MSHIDASKAPGYRGGNSINSPVSSKTSSNSATPPSTILSTQGQSNSGNSSSSQFGDMNVIKPIGQGPIQPPGPVQRPGGTGSNRMDMNFSRAPAGLFDYGNSESSYGSMNAYSMNQQQNVNTSMSRLNPKASAFSSSTNAQGQGSKVNSNQFGSSFMSPNNNNNNFMKSPGSTSSGGQQGYQRSSVNPSNASWFQEYSSYGGQGMDFSGSSPSMSPNNNSNNNNNSQQSANGPIDDSRKAPAPIGNERNYKFYGGSGYGGGQSLLDMDASSMMNAPSMAPGRNSWMDKNQLQWQMPSNMPVIPRGQYEQPPSEFPPMQDIFQVSFDDLQVKDESNKIMPTVSDGSLTTADELHEERERAELFPP